MTHALGYDLALIEREDDVTRAPAEADSRPLSAPQTPETGAAVVLATLAGIDAAKGRTGGHP